MKIGVLGTGMVGHAIATKLVSGTRCGWARARRQREGRRLGSPGGRGRERGQLADAAGFGELVVNGTAGTASLDALAAAGEESLAGKVLIDVANPLDFSQGMPPTLAFCNDDSLAERIQRAFPQAHVVKTLNTINCEVMVDPARVPGDHVVFTSGDDEDAKREVAGLLESFGWPAERIVDLGDIAAARGLEMYLPLWLSMYGRLGTGDFNIGVLRA